MLGYEKLAQQYDICLMNLSNDENEETKVKVEDNVFTFSSRPIYQFYIEENFKGEVDTFYIELKMNGRQLLQKYGEENVGKDLCKLCKEKPEETHIVIMCVTPNEEFDSEAKLSASKGKPYSSTHIHQKEEIILKEGGFDEFPAVFPRWMKDSMEIYGRSPSMKALPEIKMINAMMKTILRSAQKMVDPTLMIPDDSFLNFSSKPGGLNPYRAGTQDRVYPIETRGAIGLGMEILKDTRDRIKESFFIDQLQLREGPQMTATEVNVRTDEHLRLLGPILGRLHFELLQPMIVRILGIMIRNKLLPEGAPAELAGRTPQVFYSSQIARAQRIAEGQNLNRFLQSTLGLAEAKPEILDNINADGVANYLADIYGAPTDTLLDPKEVKKLRADRQKAQQQAQQAQLEQENAKTAELTAKAAK